MDEEILFLVKDEDKGGPQPVISLVGLPSPNLSDGDNVGALSRSFRAVRFTHVEI